MAYTYEVLPIDQVRPHPKNARTHSKKQIRQIAGSIRAVGFAAPVLIDENKILIAGHGRLEAAKSLGMSSIPAIVISGLSDAKKRALLLADNRIALGAGWNRDLLAIELAALPELLVEDDLDISITGFEPAEIDALHADFDDGSNDPSDKIDDGCLDGPAITEFGDLWQLGNHRLLCGDARNSDDLTRLLDSKQAHMAFLDPPYNVSSDEVPRDELIAFLKQTLGAAATVSIAGAVHFACMDWPHVEELVTASRSVYGAMLNLIAWVKTNAGQRGFYRSQHELIGVFRVGATSHLNTIELGRHGRSRSNVWHYAGANTFRVGRTSDLCAHPTVKPVAMIADAMKDCTRRNEIVLDTFCGSGTTILAAERVGRRGCGLEIDPRYVDVAVRRWQAFSGRDALHVASGLTFEEIGLQRSGKKMATRTSALDKHARR